MDLVEWLKRNQLAFLGLALLILGSGLALDLAGRHDPAPIEFAYGADLLDGNPIRAQIAGGVVKPGVYQLRAGDRVVDALAAAGGPSDDADISGLNLARRVRDEEQLLVPTRASGQAFAAANSIAGARLDINAATTQQLDGLPGIGEAYSRRIVDSRKLEGPYKATRDLVDRKVIPASVFDQIRDLITVSQ